MRQPYLLGLALAALLSTAPAACTGEEHVVEREELIVFAAASLTDVLELLGRAHGDERPEYRLHFNVAASSTLARQIEHGAPADLFISANAEWVERLVGFGLIMEPVTLPVTNRLVVIRRKGESALSLPRDLLRFGRVAVADPAHVPAGIYARQALQCEGLWDELQERLVPTLDVRAAVASVETGATAAAIVYASDVHLNPRVDVALDWPAECQPEIANLLGCAGGDIQ